MFTIEKIELIAGLIFNLAGILTLIISLTNYFKGIEIMLTAHETYILSVNQTSKPIIQITGADVHLKNAQKKLKRGTLISIICFVVGFSLQMTALVILSGKI